MPDQGYTSLSHTHPGGGGVSEIFFLKAQDFFLSERDFLRKIFIFLSDFVNFELFLEVSGGAENTKSLRYSSANPQNFLACGGLFNPPLVQCNITSDGLAS